MSKTGLVLSGGGARGAYQAGALVGVAEVAASVGLADPFNILSGVSAGAINVSILAGHPETFTLSTHSLASLWSKITTDKVFYVDLKTISKSGLGWMPDLPFSSQKQIYSLFSTTPLRGYLNEFCQFANIQKKIQDRRLHALSLSALEYDSNSTKTFYQGHESLAPWERPMHRSESTLLNIDHIMASSAIPILFPSIKLGHQYYGDGCIRNQSPCSPAIYLGAEKFIAIGVRRRNDTWFNYRNNEEGHIPTLVRLINVIFHSMMMDGIELDLQRISQINSHLELLSKRERARIPVRPVEYLWISPSVDFAKFAIEKSHHLPRLIRYLLKGLGPLSESSEIISYLLFDNSYSQQLVEIGYADAMKEKENIRLFFENNGIDE